MSGSAEQVENVSLTEEPELLKKQL